MECRGCGTQNGVHARQCVHCGVELLALCARCGGSLPVGARYCPACGQAVAPAPALSSNDANVAVKFLGPERKIITILFADFAGFTEYLRAHDPEVVHDWLKSTWAQVDALIAAHGGSVAKHMGDAVMALFGARESREDSTAQALRAAIAIQADLAQLRTQGPQTHLQMRIGVHCGEVVLEPLSATGEFRATGAAINLASRLEEAAPPGRILISHDVFRSVYGLFDVQPVRPLSVKGISEPVAAYLLGRAKPRAVARLLRDIEGVSTEMVGRKEELRILQTAFQRVLKTGRAELVTILGEAGIGKSRLLQAFQHWAELLPERFWFFLGQATADMPAMPFALLRDVFASRFEIRDSDTPAVAREKLESGVVSLLSRCAATGTWPKQEPKQIAHFVGHLLGMDFSASLHVRDLMRDPQQLRARAFHALRRFFTALGRGSGESHDVPFVSGVLFVAEDIHWSDQGSLDVLEDLVRGCADVPLLILCLARPTLFERRPQWGDTLPVRTRLTLEALSLEQSRTLVRTILRKAPVVPTALRDLVTDLAEGNPYFIEESIKMLIDQRVIIPGEERWDIATHRLASACIPQTLAGVLQARLNGLTPEEKAVLQRAAVIGRVFWDRALEALSCPDAADPAPEAPNTGDVFTREDINRALEGLLAKELILAREDSAFQQANEFAFKHELLRNAAYETLLKRLRRELHGRVAGWLIRQSGERSAEFAAQVAAHFAQADRLLEAAEWYGRAGTQAKAGHEPAMAIEYLRKAVRLLPARRKDLEPERLQWLCTLIGCLCEQARFPEARNLCLDIRRRAERVGDFVSQAKAWNGLAFLNERRAANHASVSAARRAEILARRAGSAGVQEQIRALYLRGWALYRLADWPAVLKLSARTQRLCSRLEDRHGLAVSLKLQGVVYLQRGDSHRADLCFQRGLQLCNESGDRRNAAAMLSNLGESARLRGDFAAGAEYYEKALAVARQIGSRESELVYLSNLSGALIGLGQFEKAEATLRQLIPQASTRTASMLSEAFSFLAEACLAQGKKLEALSAARRALELGRQSANELDTAIAWRVLGQVGAALKSHPGGHNGASGTSCPLPGKCFAQSLALFEKMNAEPEQARTLRAWATFEQTRNHPAQACRMLLKARKIFTRLHMLKELEATTAAAGKCQSSSKRGQHLLV